MIRSPHLRESIQIFLALEYIHTFVSESTVNLYGSFIEVLLQMLDAPAGLD